MKKNRSPQSRSQATFTHKSSIKSSQIQPVASQSTHQLYSSILENIQSMQAHQQKITKQPQIGPQLQKSRTIGLSGGIAQFKTAENPKKKQILKQKEPFSPKSIFSLNQDNTRMQQSQSQINGQKYNQISVGSISQKQSSIGSINYQNSVSKYNLENIEQANSTRDKSQQQASKIVTQKRKSAMLKYSKARDDIQEGDEFSIVEERQQNESVIKCRNLPTLTHLKLCMQFSQSNSLDISPKPDLRGSIANRQSNQNSRRQSSIKKDSIMEYSYARLNQIQKVVVHLGTRYSQNPSTSALQQSSCDESSCFFDELNRDESELHNCLSKNELAKQDLKLNDFITKVPNQDSSKYKQTTNLTEEVNNDTSAEENTQFHAKGADLHRSHLVHTLQSLQYIKQLKSPNRLDIEQKGVYFPQFRHSTIKKTVIFDLDETLVHCVDDPQSQKPDIVLEVKFPNGEIADAGINVRPYALDCLIEARKYFQVVVFTASHQSYADVVLDYLDPKRELIEHRLYRDSCIKTEEGVYIKDLRIIKNRNLKDVVIVDNAVYSFGYQLENGIPILPFYDDKSDEEMLHLIYYLKCISQFDDIREQNKKAFQLRDLENSNINEFLESFCSNSQQYQSQQQEVNHDLSRQEEIYNQSQDFYSCESLLNEQQFSQNQSLEAIQNQNENIENY
ncbi:nli interacting factor-like phosphatase family protein [Stylonychia lemnae]|uniref:Nli interacting factor-like phosphatase family protein n=1 Tax=Stylonychia lemnae TaxID=5949 RepID=A0A078B2I5_STYLE|nr:nli interacting factor-like phosphatase family protein [Stylonychia lemnae]|eukprot:CDW87693.1 nli interacting factor-like phosphatase family protein [Stylonychia lemnae]